MGPEGPEGPEGGLDALPVGVHSLHTRRWGRHLRRGGRAGGAQWDVARGPMLFIFVMDAACGLLNLVAVAA